IVSVRKSPNMMSTTGRKPVMAAPTPIPVKPASEIGVSITRSAPNSSTSPDKTLNGVPASATSSPKMQTRESRRISSARASRTACANVSSLVATSGIHVLVHLIGSGIRRGNRKFHRRLHLRAYFVFNRLQLRGIRDFLFDHPRREILDGIALGLPHLLFLLRAVVFPVDVPDVMPGIAIGIAKQERRAFTLARAVHQFLRSGMHCPHILSIRALRVHPKRSSTSKNVPRGRLRIMRVLGIKIVLANVNHRQLPKRRQVHHFVENALPQRAFPKKTDRDLARAQ